MIRSYWPGFIIAAFLASGAVAYHVGERRGVESERVRNQLNDRIANMPPPSADLPPCPICRGTGFLYKDGPKPRNADEEKARRVACSDCSGTGKLAIEIPAKFEPMPTLKILRRSSKVILKHMLNGTQPTDNEQLQFIAAVQSANSVPGIDDTREPTLAK